MRSYSSKPASTVVTPSRASLASQLCARASAGAALALALALLLAQRRQPAAAGLLVGLIRPRARDARRRSTPSAGIGSPSSRGGWLLACVAGCASENGATFDADAAVFLAQVTHPNRHARMGGAPPPRQQGHADEDGASQEVDALLPTDEEEHGSIYAAEQRGGRDKSKLLESEAVDSVDRAQVMRINPNVP